MSLPGADELFRTTGGMALSPSLASRSAAEPAESGSGAQQPDAASADAPSGGAPASGAPSTGAPSRGAAPAGAPAQRSGAERVPTGRTAPDAAPGTAPGAGPASGTNLSGGSGSGIGPLATAPHTRAGQAGRGTMTPQGAPQGGVPGPGGPAGPEDQQGAHPAARRRLRGRAPRRPSGRERHDEKITVYASAEELMDLEHARLVLRGEHGLAVDRGRVVRQAIAVVLADLEQRGEASILVRRLRGR
ncbi:hypothetical protein GCM10009665_69440 [Kitasatospora nipponensis]|uniref:Uncharacterized protein n=1 Tax=Kitasatospora nipponensis TaxID=258049 RepID=A0ABP4HKS3_9ACTN